MRRWLSEIYALRGSTTEGALYFTVTSAWDPSNPPLNPPDTYPSLPGTMTSNKASTIGVSFEAPTDGSGHPILTVNNFDAMPGAASSSDATDPATLTKVDLVYPSGLAGTISLTQVGGGSLPVTGILPLGSSDVRYWDSPTGGNLWPSRARASTSTWRA